MPHTVPLGTRNDANSSGEGAAAPRSAKRSRLLLGAAFAFCAAVAGLNGQAFADDYAYMATGNSVYNLGVVDLTTGKFSLCGAMETELSGLGVGSDHHLYGGEYDGSGFYSVDVTNGHLTKVATSNITFFLTGSTRKSIYAVGTDSILYTVNPADGAATSVGPLGITVSKNGIWGLSTGASKLYFTHESTLYDVNLTTGAATVVGDGGAGSFGALLLENSVLYAGSLNPLGVYILNPRRGTSAFSTSFTGSGAANPWGLAPIKVQTIKPRKICAAHYVP